VTMRGSGGAGGEAEIPYLGVIEADEHERARFCATFDPDDLEAAAIELSNRYLATLPAADAEVVRVAGDYRRCLNRHDLVAVRQLLADDFVLVDHRDASFGTVDAEEWIALQRARFQLSQDDFMMATVIHAVASPVIVIRLRTSGDLNDGGAFESLLEGLAVVRGGKLARAELFAAGEVDQAMQRFRELIGPRSETES